MDNFTLYTSHCGTKYGYYHGAPAMVDGDNLILLGEFSHFVDRDIVHQVIGGCWTIEKN